MGFIFISSASSVKSKQALADFFSLMSVTALHHCSVYLMGTSCVGHFPLDIFAPDISPRQFPLWTFPPPISADIGHSPLCSQFVSVNCRRQKHQTKTAKPAAYFATFGSKFWYCEIVTSYFPLWFVWKFCQCLICDHVHSVGGLQNTDSSNKQLLVATLSARHKYMFVFGFFHILVCICCAETSSQCSSRHAVLSLLLCHFHHQQLTIYGMQFKNPLAPVLPECQQVTYKIDVWSSH